MNSHLPYVFSENTGRSLRLRAQELQWVSGGGGEEARESVQKKIPFTACVSLVFIYCGLVWFSSKCEAWNVRRLRDGRAGSVLTPKLLFLCSVSASGLLPASANSRLTKKLLPCASTNQRVVKAEFQAQSY